MAEQPPKTRVLTLRVGEDDHTEILRKTKDAGMTTSEFLRDVFINAKLTFSVKAAKPQDYHRLLFFYNKTSNNINQLAHQVNAAHRRGVISEKTYILWLNKLTSIEALLLAGVSDVD